MIQIGPITVAPRIYVEIAREDTFSHFLWTWTLEELRLEPAWEWRKHRG